MCSQKIFFMSSFKLYYSTLNLKLMKSVFFIVTVLLFAAVSIESLAQNNYPPEIEGAREISYKQIDGVTLKLWIFNPPKHQAGDKTPAIIFFFGGGWRAGSPAQFVKQCEYLAARGMVSIVADYRVFSRHNVQANKCVSDAKSAIRWVREHADDLGVDPNRIAAGGGSAGGHLAAATATLPMFDEQNENTSISSKPNALALFNPALVLAPFEAMTNEQAERFKGLENRFGAAPESMSPYHHVVKGNPPTIIFHGIDDTTVPYKTAELFAEKMWEEGNRCILVGYEGEPHGFFNYGRKSNGSFIDTVNKMDAFFVSLGYLKAPPKTIVSD